MGETINLQEIIPTIIRNINFYNYLEKTGYIERKSNSKDYYTFYKDYGYIEDTIILSNIENQEIYYSLSFKDKGNIIDFVKNRIELDKDYLTFSPEKDHLIETCRKLVQFIYDNGENETKIEKQNTPKEMYSLINKAFTTFYKAIPSSEVTNHQYLKYFGIDNIILKNELFADRIFSTKGLILNDITYNDAINISFPLIDGNLKEIGFYYSNILEINNKKQEINLFVPGSNKNGLWSSNKPNVHKNNKVKITIVDKPIEALAHFSYLKEPRQYVSLFEIGESTFEDLKYLLTQTNYASIHLALGVSLDNFEKEYKLIIALLNIDAKYILSNFNEVKIWISQKANANFLNLIKRIKKLNTDNISSAITTLGNDAKEHMKNEMILVVEDERENLIIQIPKNFKTLYQFQKILLKCFPSKYTIISEKPKYMNWVYQNQKGIKPIKGNNKNKELINSEEVFITY